jgi:CDP-diacylglycerol--glycerol-3-phosphate 3-phosphatidyltransferase
MVGNHGDTCKRSWDHNLALCRIKRGIIAASKGGKIKSLLQNFSVGFYMLPLPEYLYTPRDILLGVAIILTVTSGYQYIRDVIKSKP